MSCSLLQNALLFLHSISINFTSLRWHKLSSSLLFRLIQVHALRTTRRTKFAEAPSFRLCAERRFLVSQGWLTDLHWQQEEALRKMWQETLSYGPSWVVEADCGSGLWEVPVSRKDREHWHKSPFKTDERVNLSAADSTWTVRTKFNVTLSSRSLLGVYRLKIFTICYQK